MSPLGLEPRTRGLKGRKQIEAAKANAFSVSTIAGFSQKYPCPLLPGSGRPGVHTTSRARSVSILTRPEGRVQPEVTRDNAG